MKKVAILAAPGFEEIELMAPLDILRRLNMDVVLAGVQSDKVVSTHEVTVSTDTMLDKLHADKLDALILPGGAGSWVLRDTPEVIHLVKKMHEAGKLVAAICAAPIVLAKAGLVRDRNVTAYPAQDVYRELNEAGAHIVKDENVVLDGNMLTANGPGAAMLFGYSIGEYLGEDLQVAQLKEQMCYTGLQDAGRHSAFPQPHAAPEQQGKGGISPFSLHQVPFQGIVSPPAPLAGRHQAGMQGREKIAPQGAIQQKAAKSPVPPVQTGKDVLRAHQLQPLFPAGKQNFPVFRRRFEKSPLFHDEMPAHQLHAVVHQTEGGG